MNTTTILIVDDHPMMRTALRITLEDQADLRVVGEAGTVAEGRRQAIALKPDLILLDLYLPDGSGLDLIHFRNEQLPGTRILVVTSSNNEKDIVDAVHAGADSYVVKDSPPEHLLLALRTVLAGKNFLTPGATGILLKQLRQSQIGTTPDTPPSACVNSRSCITWQAGQPAPRSPKRWISPRAHSAPISSTFLENWAFKTGARRSYTP